MCSERETTAPYFTNSLSQLIALPTLSQTVTFPWKAAVCPSRPILPRSYRYPARNSAHNFKTKQSRNPEESTKRKAINLAVIHKGRSSVCHRYVTERKKGTKKEIDRRGRESDLRFGLQAYFSSLSVQIYHRSGLNF